MFRGNFQVLNIRWQVQKLVFVTPADMIDQKNQLKQVAQRQKYSKTAVEVEKKSDNYLEKYPSRTMSTIYNNAMHCIALLTATKKHGGNNKG